MLKTSQKVKFNVESLFCTSKILTQRLGYTVFPGLIAKVAYRLLLGEPWRNIHPAESERERLTREQAGPALVLLDVLTDKIGYERALAITSEIVTESAVLFLKTAIPPFTHSQFIAMSREEQLKFLNECIARFPNAVVEKVEVTDECFSYDVTYCEFGILMKKLGRSELAPMFCAGDAVFFERFMPEVEFTREMTLAEGGECCPFRFRWKVGK